MNKITELLNSNIESITVNTNWIGMIYYSPKNLKKGNHIYPWMLRAFALDRELEKHNYKLLSYSPTNVNLKDKTATGYMLELNRFKQVTIPIPKVNYNFYIGSSNHKYLEFEKWALNERYQILPVKQIRKLAGDKLLTAQTLETLNKDIVPKTELYENNVEQLIKFMEDKNSVFIKPRFGSMGDGIVVIRKENNNYLTDYYNNAKKESSTFKSLEECIPFIEKYTENEKYIIQEGINAIQYEGSIFDIRVIIFNVNQTWQFLSELRLGAKSSNLSNIAQGGKSYNTNEILENLFSKEQAKKLLDRIKVTTIKIVDKLNTEYKGTINELSLDIVVDKNENIYVVEINVKPGLAGSPKLYSNFFVMNNEERDKYEKLTLKHGEYLAKSLINRCR